MKKTNKRQPGKGVFLTCFFLLGLFFASPALSAGCYLVTGAPIPEANGEYYESGEQSGVPMYAKGDWTLKAYMTMSYSWQIEYLGSVRYFTDSCDDCTTPPPDPIWRDESENPVPTLRVYPCGQVIPALNPWGLALFIALLLASSWFLMRKGRKGTV